MVVLGVGGLGHMAVQLLRVLAPVRIVTADVDDRKLRRIHAETTEVPLTEAVDVSARLKAGQIPGRAVLIPG